MRVHHEKRSDWVRDDHEKKRAIEFTMRKRAHEDKKDGVRP